MTGRNLHRSRVGTARLSALLVLAAVAFSVAGCDWLGGSECQAVIGDVDSSGRTSMSAPTAVACDGGDEAPAIGPTPEASGG